jgi:phosphonate transport system substrate-binding protein
MSIQKKIILIFIVLITSIFIGCSNNPKNEESKQIPFDFSDSLKIDSSLKEGTEESNTIRFAVSAISSPKETFTYYNDMVKYIEKETGMRVELVQRKTYKEINNLLKNGYADIAIVCSGGYIYGVVDSAYKLLVVPLRDGKKHYYAYIIAHNDSDIEDFQDLKGKKFAFTDPLSTSGKIYPIKRLNDNKSTPDNYFSSYTFTYAHDNSIQLVAKKIVDGAAVNSLVFDYLRITSPERTKNIKVVERSESFAMPPVVVSNHLSENTIRKLEEIFLNLHKDSSSKKVLEQLMVDKYVKDNDSIYSSVRKLAGFNDM